MYKASSTRLRCTMQPGGRPDMNTHPSPHASPTAGLPLNDCGVSMSSGYDSCDECCSDGTSPETCSPPKDCGMLANSLSAHCQYGLA